MSRSTDRPTQIGKKKNDAFRFFSWLNPTFWSTSVSAVDTPARFLIIDITNEALVGWCWASNEPCPSALATRWLIRNSIESTLRLFESWAWLLSLFFLLVLLLLIQHYPTTMTTTYQVYSTRKSSPDDLLSHPEWQLKTRVRPLVKQQKKKNGNDVLLDLALFLDSSQLRCQLN